MALRISKHSAWLLISVMACGGARQGAPKSPNAAAKPDASLALDAPETSLIGLEPLEDAKLAYTALTLPSSDSKRIETLTKAFAEQVRYADTRRRMGLWSEATRALAGAMAMVRTGEAERLPLSKSTRRAIAGFADAFARAHREGEALGCYSWLSRPGDPMFDDAAYEHARAVQTWMAESQLEESISWDSAEARARAHAWFPSVQFRKEAEGALAGWISVLRAASSHLGRAGSRDLRGLQVGVRNVGPELVALYLRDGDAVGAADALERADKNSGKAAAAALRAYAEHPDEKHVTPILGFLGEPVFGPDEKTSDYPRAALSAALLRALLPMAGKDPKEASFSTTLRALDMLRLSHVSSAFPRPNAARVDARLAATVLLQDVGARELGNEDVARAERALRDAEALLHEGEPDPEDTGPLRLLTYLRSRARSLAGDYAAAEAALKPMFPLRTNEPGRLELAEALEGQKKVAEATKTLREGVAPKDAKETLRIDTALARLKAFAMPTSNNVELQQAIKQLCADRPKDAALAERYSRCVAPKAAMGESAANPPPAVEARENVSAKEQAQSRAFEASADEIFRGVPLQGMSALRAAIDAGVMANDLVYPALWTQSVLPPSGADRNWLSTHIFVPAEQDPRWRGRIATFGRTGDWKALRASAHEKLEIAESDFYDGVVRFRSNDRAGAKAAWTRVVEAAPVGLQEYEFSLWFLTLKK